MKSLNNENFAKWKKCKIRKNALQNVLKMEILENKNFEKKWKFCKKNENFEKEMKIKKKNEKFENNNWIVRKVNSTKSE